MKSNQINELGGWEKNANRTYNPGQKPTGQYDILSTFVIKVKIREDFSHPHSPLAMLCSLMVCEHAGITLIMTTLF